MILMAAEDVNVDYGRWVRLYQSDYFKDEFPEDNEHFQNVTFTADVEGDREKSLKVDAAADVLGAQLRGSCVHRRHGRDCGRGFELFTQAQPEAMVVPVISTGGAVLEVEDHLVSFRPSWSMVRGCVTGSIVSSVSHHAEERFRIPEDEPSKVADRYWQLKGT